ncbi:hypothetical protein BRADI_1g30570v3 [Brachypodium distachyon]|uniref:Secreted protein n=1 Tax=Brachypodium distachyon TaxID=15368 RepID=I1GVG4_BRADI|nr:hypothetical protein BRADI_1g30570v3 [Brachypodium distachyon]
MQPTRMLAAGLLLLRLLCEASGSSRRLGAAAKLACCGPDLAALRRIRRPKTHPLSASFTGLRFVLCYSSLLRSSAGYVRFFSGSGVRRADPWKAPTHLAPTWPTAASRLRLQLRSLSWPSSPLPHFLAAPLRGSATIGQPRQPPSHL